MSLIEESSAVYEEQTYICPYHIIPNALVSHNVAF